jgi:hypothetical protein
MTNGGISCINQFDFNLYGELWAVPMLAPLSLFHALRLNKIAPLVLCLVRTIPESQSRRHRDTAASDSIPVRHPFCNLSKGLLTQACPRILVRLVQLWLRPQAQKRSRRYQRPSRQDYRSGPPCRCVPAQERSSSPDPPPPPPRWPQW